MKKDPKGLLRKATRIPGGRLEDYTNRDRIGGNDVNDLYRFKVGDRSTLNLDIDKLKANADVDVFQFKRPLRKVNRAIGSSDFSELSKKNIRKNLKRVGRSKERGKKPESITSELETGTYVIRVYSGA